MNQRTQQILEAVIRDFIETGDPVSSKQLARKQEFNIKPATIRNELNELISDGFLFQPHISSGRVPTDKGYRFFIDRVFEDFAESLTAHLEREISDLTREISRGDFEDFVQEISDHLGVFGAGYESREKAVYKSGLDELFEKLISDVWTFDRKEIYEVARDIENLDEKMADLENFISKNHEPKVFIGRSPITKSQHLSVIAQRLDADGESFVVAAIGPKRMDYEEGIRFFAKLKGY